MASIKLTGDTSGEITIAAPAVAGTNTLTLPANTGNIVTTGDSGTITQGMIGSGVVGKGPAFAARLTSTQSINTNTWTKMALATETFDTNNNYDNVTNYRFTPTVAGYYYFTAAGFVSITAGQREIVSVYKNGSEAITALNTATTVGGGVGVIVSGILYANGSTDYFEGWFYQDGGSTASLSSATQLTWFDGHLVRAA